MWHILEEILFMNLQFHFDILSDLHDYFASGRLR